MAQNDDKVDFFQFSFWFLKDIFWFLKWKALAMFMAIPTVILTVYLMVKTKKLISTNTIFSSWVMTNVFWMSHELYRTPLALAKIFIVTGVATLVMYILKLLKNIKYDESVN